MPNDKLDRIRCKALIYVVGHSRGGTTWLGSLLSLHPELRYIFEPFASQAHPYTGIDTQALFNNNRLFQKEKRSTETEYISPSFFNMIEDNPALEPYVPLVQIHQARLVEKLFGDVADRYVAFKQPRMENFGWALGAIKPDKALVIDRDPFGIINSYHRGNFWKWLSLEYPLAAQTVPEEYPQFAPLFDGERDLYEKLLILSYIRSQVVREYCRERGILVIHYQDLCFYTVDVMRQVAEAIGLPLTEAYEAKLDAAAHPETTSEGWLDVNKDPQARVFGWRKELPENVVERLSAFIQRYHMDVVYPGGGLPELTAEETAASRALDRRRARADAPRRIIRYLRKALH